MPLQRQEKALRQISVSVTLKGVHDANLLALTQELRVGNGFRGVALSPVGQQCISREDSDLITRKGLAVVDCSWAQLDDDNILLRPVGHQCISREDSDLITRKGLAVVDCSWTRLDDVPFTMAMLSCSMSNVKTNLRGGWDGAVGVVVGAGVEWVGGMAGAGGVRTKTHFESGAARRAATTANIPVINVAAVPGQHPTQKLEGAEVDAKGQSTSQVVEDLLWLRICANLLIVHMTCGY
ncbi:ribosome biogenesis protein TSR3 [Tanacetum coccineum]|uniref:Ribosome biogenesis protein TSR3 n=1 Tax=Tanacetum coccineum TaxID=301880 RepID=A0ABQ5A311_9ASTR